MARCAVAVATLAALATPSVAYRFMAIGDWGASFEGKGLERDTCTVGNVCAQQAADAVQMGKYAAANKVGHVMLLGDNFYGSGIHGDDTSCRFKKTFEDVYDAASLQDIPFYAIAGNHDHGGNVSAQIAYTADQSRWKYPDWFYGFNRTFTEDGRMVTIDFFMIDTVIAGASEDGEYSKELQEEHPHRKYLPDAAPRASTQWQWLEKQLAASTADYIWVGGHYPVWSGCEHGPTLGLLLKLKPMLEKYHVSGYMCGHDHCEEHIDEGKGPVYVLTGSGFECCYSSKNAHKVPAGAIKMAYWKGECPTGAQCPTQSPNSAFTVFDVTASEMTVTYIDSAGKILFKAPPIKPRTPEQKRVGVSQL